MQRRPGVLRGDGAMVGRHQEAAVVGRYFAVARRLEMLGAELDVCLTTGGDAFVVERADCGAVRFAYLYEVEALADAIEAAAEAVADG